MAALTADVTQGTLTGSGTQDTVATAGVGSKQETWSVMFRNYSGSARTLTLMVNGTADQNKIASLTLLTLEFTVITLSVGANDVMRAEGSAGSAIAWTCTKGILT